MQLEIFWKKTKQENRGSIKQKLGFLKSTTKQIISGKTNQEKKR